jgi:diguanylate cyclase (GGDEF)-like protein/PAS domain S-box-containing protein
MQNTQTKDMSFINDKTLMLSVIVSIILTTLVGYSYYWNINNIHTEKLNLALAEAKSNWNKDASFRQWATLHGGVYVKPNERTPASEAMAHLPERDVVTTEGMELTLMNPAYMLRQMTEEFEQSYGIKGKITGKKLLNPVNKADAWQLKALNIFESGNSNEIFEQQIIDGQPYLRYMKPMYMTEGCVKCHAVLGFKDGDLRGGVSVSIPLAPYFSAANDTNKSILITHIIVWLFGLITIIIFAQVVRKFLFKLNQSIDSLHTSDKKYRGLLENAPDCMVIVNANAEIETVNRQLQEMTGYTVKELIGQPVEVLIPKRFKDHKQKRDEYIANPHMRFMGEGKNLFVQRKNGTEFPAEISLSPMKTEDNLIISVVIRDITERKHVEEQLIHQANHDLLTGLVNRREFERRAERLLSTGNKDEHALCFMDLDQFKVVNDTCGHTAGDELLRQLGSLLQNTIRHRDTLARMGGDEFGVLMEHCSLNGAHRVAITLQKAIQDYQFIWEGHNFRVGVSIGLVAITNTSHSLTDLLKQADAACYMAKDKGRNRIHVYHPDDTEIAHRHGEIQWVSRLNQALEEDRFCLYAQAIVPLDGSTDIHYELLIRMFDEDGAVIPPGAFLPAAERYGLISKIDRWVVKNALSSIATNPTFHENLNFCSINLSGQSIIDNDFLDFVVTQLNESGIDGKKICFEITETAAISNLNSAIKFISTLKELGCQFALDDFGSGLSSFGYLKNLPVDFLKIDGIFVKDIIDDPIDRAMVKSINEIGQVMGMPTIAEFVENNEIKGMLKEIGVNYAQGYGIDKPTPFDELLDRSDKALAK